MTYWTTQPNLYIWWCEEFFSRVPPQLGAPPSLSTQ